MPEPASGSAFDKGTMGVILEAASPDHVCMPASTLVFGTDTIGATTDTGTPGIGDHATGHPVCGSGLVFGGAGHTMEPHITHRRRP